MGFKRQAHPPRCRVDSTFPRVEMTSIPEAGMKAVPTGSLTPVYRKQVVMVNVSKDIQAP